MMKHSISVAVGCLLTFTAVAANDPDSFGRPVRYLDVATSLIYNYFGGQNPCQPAVAGTSCVQLGSTANSVSFSEPNILHIDLPANATHSLLCFSLSPTVNVTFQNSTVSMVHASATLRTDAAIQSAALADPSLINRLTGQPFDGKIVALGLTRYLDAFPLPAQNSVIRASTDSRECVMGLLSLATLQSRYGLSLAQARTVFATPMTVTLAAQGAVQNISIIQWVVGLRLFGD
jgi:hypothetical protein